VFFASNGTNAASTEGLPTHPVRQRHLSAAQK
jgi:hypothetical protein